MFTGISIDRFFQTVMAQLVVNQIHQFIYSYLYNNNRIGRKGKMKSYNVLFRLKKNVLKKYVVNENENKMKSAV